MGGFYGVVSQEDCVPDLFYGTDYHSHLGTRRGGLAVVQDGHFKRAIHNIENAQFRSKFEDDIKDFSGKLGIGIISDYEDQPLIIGSHLGNYAIVTVGKINNEQELLEESYTRKATHFSEMGNGEINPTELIATIINQGDTFADGIRKVQKQVKGSCSLMILTQDGIYAARDKLGRTAVVIGEKEGSVAVTMETCALPNLDYKNERYLGPGEAVFISKDQTVTQVVAPGEEMQVCSFLWVYYGFPASSYEGINAEASRYRNGRLLAKRDEVKDIDCVAGIPDSGSAHALGYSHETGCEYQRPFVKYTPTWPRSFMPQDQRVRDLVARMKLIPIEELIRGRKLMFSDDSIVRGTQLRDTVTRLYEAGAEEIHMRPACPPLVYGCKFLNFSRSRSELDLATRRAIKEFEGEHDKDLAKYADPDSEQYKAMVEWIRKSLNLSSLQFQRLDDLVEAIGLPKCKLCTYCFDGAE